MNSDIQPKILIVEDDKNMGFLLSKNLKMAGYDLVLSQNGEDGFRQFQKNKFNLCILDIMLPGMNGIALAKQIRKTDQHIPVIFLTSRSLDEDKIEGFKVGCDDYITKPFSIEELLWRIKAIFKRTGNDAFVEEQSIYKIGIYNFNYVERTLTINNNTIQFSAKEADLLKLFCQHKNKVITRSVILKTVWGRDDYYVSKSLDVYLTKLRKHIKEDVNIEIQNIHGYGYKLIEKDN